MTKILTVPNPKLRIVALEVIEFDKRLGRIAKRMLAKAKKEGAYGLAAPQIGISKRIIVYTNKVDELAILVNPVITGRSEKKIIEFESCLSIPNMVYLVPRSRSVQVSGYDIYGKKDTILARKKHARILLHEINHLDGKLIEDIATNSFALDKTGKIIKEK